MSALTRLATLLAALAGVGVIVWLVLRGTPTLPEIPSAPPPSEIVVQDEPDLLPGRLPTPRQGGVVSGRVMGEGAPVPGARVLLVRYNAGDPAAVRRYREQLERDGVPDPTLIPTVGEHLLAGETRADPEGRFAISAGGDAYISHIVAFHPGWFPEVVDLRLMPRDERGDVPMFDVNLDRAGRLIGHVVDGETREPVRGARVTLYLQQIARPVAAPGEDEVASVRVGSEGPAVPRSAMATLGRFLPKILGERVWGIPDTGSEGLELLTNADGRFELGPLGPDVQVEIVVTHPEYQWLDLDNPDGKTQPVRTVVRPGETVERELPLKRGGEVAGRVIDNVTGKGIPGALIEVESISAYFRHWWYRHKARRAVTDDEGRFRVAGLAIGSQSVTASHASFGRKQLPSVEPGEKNLVIGVDPLAGLRGTVIGAGDRPPGGRVQLHMQRVAEDGGTSSSREQTAVLGADSRFLVSQLEAGTVRVWLQFGRLASLPQTVELEPHGVTDVDFRLGGGGTVEADVRETSGRIVDPATLRLIAADDATSSTLGTFVTREGRLDAEGVMPGSYRFAVEAPGFVRVLSEPFDVQEDEVTRVELPRLVRLGELIVGPVLDGGGRPYAGRDGPVIVEVRVGGEEAGWTRFIGTLGAPRVVQPGPVAVRARVEGSELVAENQGVVASGGSLRLELRLRAP
ncbi:MAG: carboxypeptidase regulatory-like domain-containing protein [Planctomycetota bacterium]